MKFARYPLEKSSMLTSLELKSKLRKDLLNPSVFHVKLEVSILLGGEIVLPIVGRKWKTWTENHKSLSPL